MHLQRRGWHATFNVIARLAERFIARYALHSGIDVIRDVPYGPHPVAHRLDIYRPRALPRPLPVMLYIHGGGFVVCSKETHRGIAVLNAAGPGYLVFNINYRLAPANRFPAAIEDACAAYCWVVANAARFGGDPRRIVVAGESAGGNLALGVAIAATYRRPEPYAQKVYATGVVPAAVMPITPFLQVSDSGRHRNKGRLSAAVARDVARLYLGHTGPGTDETLMADPIRVLEGGRPRRRFPEVLSGVGTSDLCCADVRRLRSACKKLGIPARVLYYRGEVHAFHVLRWRKAARRFWEECALFMHRIALATPVAISRPTTRALRRVARLVPRVIAPKPSALRAASRAG